MQFQEIGTQKDELDPLVITRFYNPINFNLVWYATEYNPVDNTCYGYVSNKGIGQWMNFSISWLEGLKLPMGLHMECDVNNRKKAISKYCPELIPIIERQKQITQIEKWQKEKSNELER